MHRSARNFINLTVKTQHFNIPGFRVLEIGSRIINGTVRDLFDKTDYIGVDIKPGPGVDIVADGATFASAKPFDVVVCCEVLEHTPQAGLIVANAYRLLRNRGWLLLTTAAPGRRPHTGEGIPGPPSDYYRNIEEEELWGWLNGFAMYQMHFDRKHKDWHAWAQK